MNIKMGIQKRQWLLLFLVVSLPLLLNAIAIWFDIGSDGILHLLKGTYIHLDAASFPDILSGLLPNIVFLGFLSWLVIFVSNRTFFQKQWFIAKVFESLSVVLLIAKVFEAVTGFFMPFAWLPEFHDYLLGVPFSSFTAYWSRWLIFPATAILLFIATILPKNEHLGKIFKLAFLIGLLCFLFYGVIVPNVTGQYCPNIESGQVPNKAEEMFLQKIMNAIVAKDYAWLATVSTQNGLKQIREVQPMVTKKFKVIGKDDFSGGQNIRIIEYENGSIVQLTYFGTWSCPDFVVSESEVFQSLQLSYIEKYDQ